jgi:hypothetical protein
MSDKNKYVNYTIELGDEICEAVHTQSLNQFLKNDKSGRLPSIQAVYNWFAKYPEFKKKYIESRKIRALHRAEEIDCIKEDMRNGLMDVNIARVWIDATKWQAGKENQGLFGDKLELSGDADKPLSVAWTVVPVRPVNQSDNADT